MAKKIKAIQCPQCGSAQQSLIKEDHYRCGSCGAEYILDNDDINVNVRHEVVGNQPTPVDPAKVRKIAFTALAVIVGFIILMIISNSTGSDSGGTINDSIYERYSASSIANYSSKPIALVLSQRTYRKGYQDTDDARNGFYLSFYDLEKNTIIKTSKIENISFAASSSDHYKARYFASIDKNLIILNKSNILEIDFEELKFKDITEDILSKHSDFDAGIASIDFEYKHRAEGFKILTNIGKNLSYFPASNYLINNNDRADKIKISDEELVDKVTYMFTKESMYFPDKPIQLMKLNYLYHINGQQTKPYSLEWVKDYYSKEKDAKKLDLNSRSAKVKSYEDFTPDRYYFDPKVLYQTDETLLIKYKPTPAEDAPTLFQLLNLETKEPIWTKQFSGKADFSYISNVGLTDDYYIIHHNYVNYYLIPIKDGDIQEVKLNAK